MRVQMDQSELLGMLQTVIDAVPSKSTLPILSMMLMVIEEGTCSLSGTDLEVFLTTTRTVQDAEDGRITFPGRLMFDFVRELPPGPVTISEADGRVTLKSANGECSLLGMPANEFPTVPKGIEGGVTISVDGDLLRRMIEKTAFAVHPDQTRPVLSSICWRVNPNGMVMVATDGHRLAKISEVVEGIHGDPLQVIVAPRVLQQVERLIRDDNKLESITIGERQIHFAYSGANLVTRLVEGKYVDVESVIPKDNNRRLIVSKEELQPAVRRMQILSSQQNHQVRLALHKDELELSTVNRDTGAEARERISAQYDDEEMEIGYNANYLKEVLSKIDSEQVEFHFREPVSAAIIKPAKQPEGEDYFCLLMPLRLLNTDS